MKGFKLSNEYAEELGEIYAKAPKAVIAAIAVSALTTGGDYLDHAQEFFLKEWQTLYKNGIIKQKPVKKTRCDTCGCKRNQNCFECKCHEVVISDGGGEE